MEIFWKWNNGTKTNFYPKLTLEKNKLPYINFFVIIKIIITTIIIKIITYKTIYKTNNKEV